ncbi:copper chaperone PCu(A)C [Prescottella agglutinans]|uniref:Copper chaperone PCu(A)C n=1 Tax=Prescottella agglutinans TaxID=1644129 RepID=A0A438BIC2_9NOCA|nr:copper chaperone PCu(A)C [Prescottella agglutinans]RVW10826.1 copper chaperone PCu(A)C [Prescottella agglutinans]
MKAFTRTRVLAIGVTVAAGLTLAGCSSDSKDDAKATDAASITVQDSWVKAADGGMTALFGTIRNDSDSDVTLVSATSSASPRVELHEMAPDGTGAMKMREKDGGMTIKAHDTYALKPGADHIMLFDLPAPVQAGSEVSFTLKFSDGATTQITSQVRDFTGARESYNSHGEAPSGAPSVSPAPSEGHDMANQGHGEAHSG